MKKAFQLKRFLLTFLILTTLGVSALQPTIVHAEENSVIPKSGLVKLAGSSGPILTAVAGCAINVGIYFLLKAINEVVDDAKSVGIPSFTAGNISAAGRGSQATQMDFFKNVCIKPVERAAAQVIIKGLTQRTLAWINNGFSESGQSIFPHDVNSLFKDLQKEAIGDFTATYAFNDKKYPFGKVIAQDLIAGIQSRAEKNAEYSLDRYIASQHPGKTSLDYAADFKVGSWGAFEASFSDNNNPVGFRFSVEDELLKKIENDQQGTRIGDIKLQLARNDGFLDIQRCTAPASYDPKTSPQLAKGAQEILADRSGVYDDTAMQAAKNMLEKNTCIKWETVTPGKVASESLTNALGSPLRQLEMGQDLNAALTAIFDAAINQLIKKGLSSLDKPSNITTPSTTTSTTDSTGTTKEDTSQWYEQNPEFDLLTDLPAIIELETNFKASMEKQVEVLKKTIPASYELDLCIPGPRPNWDLEAAQKLTNYLSKLSDPVCTSYTSHTFLGIKTSTDDNGPCAAMKEITGLEVEADPIKKAEDFSANLTEIFERYKKVMKENYGPGFLASQAYEAKKVYQRNALYTQQIEQAKDDASAANGTIHAMQILQERVKMLPDKTDPTYQGKLSSLQLTFERSVPNLHTQVDLDSAEAMLLKFEDEYKTITDPGDGLIDACYKETSDPLFVKSLPTTRRAYPADMHITDSRATLSKAFLPDWVFGTGEGRSLKVDDLFQPYHGSADGRSVEASGNGIKAVLVGNPFAHLSIKNGAGVEGHDTVGNGQDFSVFEDFLGIY